MDWLPISAKHDLGVLQNPVIANFVYLDIPNEKLEDPANNPMPAKAVGR
jgi:hypothetical protein